MKKVGKWQKQSKEWLPGTAMTAAPICLGSSIWVDSKGLVEFHSDSGTVSPKVRYPTLFTEKQWSGSVITCKYKDDSIVVIDGPRSFGIVFNTKTRKFSDIFSFHGGFGHYSSCVTVGDYVHIFHGNGTGDYTVCSLTDKSCRIFQDHYIAEPEQELYDVSVMKTSDCYQSTNKLLISGFSRNQNGEHIPSVIADLIFKFYNFELFKFGGLDLRDGQCVDSFYVGTLKDGDSSKPIQWELAPEFRLKHPLRAFGYIQHGPLIVTFGGVTNFNSQAGMGRRTGVHIDDIYILDLRNGSGWVQSSIKCPQKADYHAVLDKEQRIHLHERTYGRQNHYCMDVEKIIDSKFENVESLQCSWINMHVYFVVFAILLYYLNSKCFQ